MSRGLPRLGLLDAAGAAGAGLTLLVLSAPAWYEVNDGYFSAWRFHSWLDLVVAAFCAAVVAVPLTRLAPAPSAPARAGRVALVLGAVAVAMLVFRVVAGEPDLYNPSGAELDIASRGAGVFLCLFLAVATLGPVAAAVRIRRRGGPVPALHVSASRPADWLTVVAGLVLLGALTAGWYGTGYLDDSAFEALTVIDVVLLVLAVAAILNPWLPAGVLLPFAAAGLVLVVVRTIWLPDTNFINAGYDERLPGLWVGLVATAAITAGATARRRRST